MGKALLLWALTNILLTSSVHSQSLAVTADKIAALRSASFTEIVRFKFSFEDRFSTDSFFSQVSPDKKEKQLGGYYRITGQKDQYLFDGKQTTSLNLKDSTYSLSDKPVVNQFTRSLLYWGKRFRDYTRTPANILKLRDTIIGKNAFHHYLVKLADSLHNGVHVHDYVRIITNKTTQLPVCIVSDFLGFADDGATIGAVEQHFFSGYRLNEKNLSDLSIARIPPGFRLPVPEKDRDPLPDGTPAPTLELVDANGKKFDMGSLRGRIVLLNFALLGCPHSVNSAQMLEALEKKYRQDSFQIISIYLGRNDSQPAIAAFDARFGIRYPSYICSTAADETYSFRGFPHFVLLDKEGKILKNYDGFYKTLEEELTREIERSE